MPTDDEMPLPPDAADDTPLPDLDDDIEDDHPLEADVSDDVEDGVATERPDPSPKNDPVPPPDGP